MHLGEIGSLFSELNNWTYEEDRRFREDISYLIGGDGGERMNG